MENLNLKKFATGAGTLFSRAVQFTEEKFGHAEKTELDLQFDELLNRADRTKLWTEKLTGGVEAVLQPNPNNRVEDMLYKKLEKGRPIRDTNLGYLGTTMVEAGNDFGPGTSYGNSLIKMGQTELKLAQAEKEFATDSYNNFLQPLRSFLEGDMRTIMKEKKVLMTKRLDLDACKSRLRRARQLEQQQGSAGPNPEDNVGQAEADLRKAQTEFDRQAEISKLLLEGITSTHAHHLRCTNDFVEAQVQYYAAGHQHMLDLQRQLGNLTPASGPQTPAGSGLNPILSSSQNGTTTTIIPTNDLISSNGFGPEMKRARVLYDFDAADATEMNLHADEVIEVTTDSSLGPDWMVAKKGSESGKVPTTYLELLDFDNLK